jgi:glycosyltransferase involved in cell wall biosynthesis
MTQSAPVKKVLVYKSQLLPYSETFIREQTRCLKSWKGVLVGDQVMANGLALDGLDVRVLGNKNRILRKLNNTFNELLDRPSRSAVRRLRGEHAQLLHVHFATEAVRIWPLIRELQLPTLVTLHGFDINVHREYWEAGRGGRRLKNYPQRLLELANYDKIHFLAVSASIKKSAIEYGIPEHKISVSYIGIDTDQFAPGPIPMAERRQVLFVGRMVEKKGCEYLLKAFADIQDACPQSELLIVGSGPLEASLKAVVEQRGLRARFLGALPSEQIRALLGSARVLCMPSITAENGDAEGLGIVLLEAQASGVPVITSARGGATEGIQHGKTGFAHEEKDVEALKGYLKEILLDDQLAVAFGVAAREHCVKNMNITSCTRILEGYYDTYSRAFQRSSSSEAGMLTSASR